MRIAIDFDDTYTLDPDFWDAVAAIAEGCGHRILIVTCRRGTDENMEIVRQYTGDQYAAFFTDLNPKRDYMDRQGLPVDVWIDDDPNCVEHGK